MGCAQQAGWGRSKGRERCEEQFGAAEHRHNQQLLWLQLKHKTRARVSMETSPALRISEDLVPQGPRSAPCLSLGERCWGCSSSTVPHPDPEVSSSCSVPEPWELLVQLLRVLYYPN